MINNTWQELFQDKQNETCVAKGECRLRYAVVDTAQVICEWLKIPAEHHRQSLRDDVRDSMVEAGWVPVVACYRGHPVLWFCATREIAENVESGLVSMLSEKDIEDMPVNGSNKDVNTINGYLRVVVADHKRCYAEMNDPIPHSSSYIPVLERWSSCCKQTIERLKAKRDLASAG